MSDAMTFPPTFEEFLEQYKIVDKKQVYTNGADLIPIFRILQWAEYEHCKNLCKDFVPVEKIVERIEKGTPPYRSKLKETATNLEGAMEELSSKVYDISFVVEEVKEEYHQLTKEQTDKLIDLMLHLMAELNISKAKAADIYESVADIIYGKDK